MKDPALPDGGVVSSAGWRAERHQETPAGAAIAGEAVEMKARFEVFFQRTGNLLSRWRQKAEKPVTPPQDPLLAYHALRDGSTAAPGGLPPISGLALPDGAECIDGYWLSPPYARAAIVRQGGSVEYRVIEPVISPAEHLLLEEVNNHLRDVILYNSPKKNETIIVSDEELRSTILRFDRSLPADRIGVLTYLLRRTFQGYGRLDPLMQDEGIEDISCNSAGVPIFIYHRRYANIPTSLIFGTEELNRFVLKLAQKSDKQISLSNPLVDASLPEGSRIQLTYSDAVSTRGSSFTIRKFRKDPMNPVTLMEYATFTPALLATLWLCIENRTNMLIVGGTACGKTSTMNALSFFIPQNAKIVSLEDTREIQIPHKNWLATQTRDSGSRDGYGEIDLFSLLRSSLRQRPEYIIVGEVRGREAQTLFQAMNTGHTTFSTLHAGSIDETLNRLVNEPINVPPAMLGALDLIVIQGLHYRGGRAIRRCDALHELQVGRDGRVDWTTVSTYDYPADSLQHDPAASDILARIARARGWSETKLCNAHAVRQDCLEDLLARRVADPGAILLAINAVRGDLYV